MRKLGGGYQNQTSIFDKISTNDVILAFFPCTRFESRIMLAFRGEQYQLLNKTDKEKLQISMKLHDELHENYELVSKLAYICLDRDFKLIIENPYTQPHYLTNYWCIKPKVIDKNRRENGDYMEKPTQFFFINCEPKNNIIFEPMQYVEKRVCDYVSGKDRARIRSEIHPQYAERFIKKYVIDYQTDFEKMFKGE